MQAFKQMIMHMFLFSTHSKILQSLIIHFFFFKKLWLHNVHPSACVIHCHVNKCKNKAFLAHLSRRLIVELIGYSWSGVRPSSSSTMLKDLLLRNRFGNESQILCGASVGRGNDILLATSGSHDQDGGHAHIWSKHFKIFFSRTGGPIFTSLGR